MSDDFNVEGLGAADVLPLAEGLVDAVGLLLADGVTGAFVDLLWVDGFEDLGDVLESRGVVEGLGVVEVFLLLGGFAERRDTFNTLGVALVFAVVKGLGPFID